MPRRTAALVALPFLLYAACDDPAGLPELRLGDGLTEIHRSLESALREPTHLVIGSQAEWEALWPSLRTGLAPWTPPEVNFDESLVLVAGYGAVPTGGYLIHIDSLVTGGTARTAHVTRYHPRRCVTTQSETQPVHVVAVPRAGAAIRFDDRERLYDCE